jgi:hypothetical protein
MHRWVEPRVEWSFGKSDIEGKTAREAASELGRERVSNGREEHMSQCGQGASFNRGKQDAERNAQPAFAMLRRGRRPTRLRPGRAPPWRALNVQCLIKTEKNIDFAANRLIQYFF